VLGRREMQFAGADCRVIDEAVALVIAVTLYPNTSLIGAGIPLDPSTAASLQDLFGREPVDPDPSTLPPPPPAPDPAPARATGDVRGDAQRADTGDPARSPTHDARRAPGWDIAVDAAATFGVGQLPGASAGAAAHIAITPPSLWPIELGAVIFPGKRARADGTSGSARFDALAASLALCPWRPECRSAPARRSAACTSSRRASRRGTWTATTRSQTWPAARACACVWPARSS
jgi:hypothetical protein